MIAAICKVYYDTTEQSIKNYWRHCGYTTNEDACKVVMRLISEGWTPAREKAEEFMVMTEMRKHYKGGVPSATRFGLKPPTTTPVYFGNSKLNGICWHVWTNK
jgi:hypothetical protein